MTPRPARRRHLRGLALGVVTALAASTFTLSAATAATAAPDDSRVTIPLANVGEGAFVSVSKTTDLTDGETVTISGRMTAAASQYVVNQAVTEYRPGPGLGDILYVRESSPVVATTQPDPDAPGVVTFSTTFDVRAELTDPVDGSALDGRVSQFYLVLGGGAGADFSTVSTSQYGPSQNFYVPLAFQGGADVLAVDTPVTVSAHPSGVTADPGQRVTFEGAATGDPVPTYEWQVSENNGESWSVVPGETGASLTRTVAAADDGLQYRLRASNRTGKAYTAAATLTVNLPESTGELEPWDPTTKKLSSEGSYVHVTPLTGLVDGQEIAVDAFYSSILENFADGSPWPHLLLTQTDSLTAQEQNSIEHRGLLLGSGDGDGYAVDGTFRVSRHITGMDGGDVDCLITQCYLTAGGPIFTEDWSGWATDPQNLTGYVSLGAEGADSPEDLNTTRRFPLFFEGTELVEPEAPERSIPAFTTQPADVSTTAGYAAQFTVAATGAPAPTFQWQRSSDGGETWQTLRGTNSSTLRFETTLGLDGTQYRARALNDLGTAYSEAAVLAVVAGDGGANDPGAPFGRSGVTLDWTGSAELQKRSPAYTANYYSAGVSEGTKATYKNKEGDAVIVFRANSGAESVQTYENLGRHMAPVGSSDAPGIQLVRLTNGTATPNASGGGTVTWDATWSINFYGGMVPFTLSDPVLTWDANGTGTLRADLSGFGSSMDDPTVKHELEPVLGARLATFSNATIGADGTFSATPDWQGVEVETPEDIVPQDRTGDDWGSWPQEFVDFQFATGLSSYWYSSGGAADPHKAPSPFSVTSLFGYEITAPAEATAPAVPAAPSLVVGSASSLVASWAAPTSDGGSPITGFIVSLTGPEGVTSIETDADTTDAEFFDLAPGAYSASVVALNAIGSSAASGSSAVVILAEGQPTAQPVLADDALFDEPSATGFDVTVIDGVATITVPDREGEWIGVSFHSDPVWLGWHRVTDGAVRVELPTDATGAHHLVVYAADGSVVGYAAVDLGSAPGTDDSEGAADGSGEGTSSGSGSATGPGSGASAGSGLATTGGELDSALISLAALLLLSGAVAVIARRRRVASR